MGKVRSTTIGGMLGLGGQELGSQLALCTIYTVDLAIGPCKSVTVSYHCIDFTELTGGTLTLLKNFSKKNLLPIICSYNLLVSFIKHMFL